MSGRAYRLVCTVTGLLAAWLPLLGIHGPIPEKFDSTRLNGAVAVWGLVAAGVARLVTGRDHA